MRPSSLRRELTRASMLTTFVVLLLCAAALLAYELDTFRSSWVADLRTQADLIAKTSEAPVVFNDRKSAEENLLLLKLQPRLVAAVIFAKDGSVFARYVEAGVTVPAAIGQALAESGYRFSGSMLELVYPVVHDGEQVGVLYLQAEHDVWARVGTYALILAAVMSIGLAVAVAVFGRFLQRVTGPLKEMTDVAHEVMNRRAWDLRVQETRYRDIGVLVGAFNGMLDEVQARTGELEVEMAERVHAEHELRLADRRKDEFLAMLAHELRNPLAPMTNALALLRSPAADPSVRANAHAILDRQLAHMVRFIDDLLDVSRMSTGKLTLQQEALDLVPLLRAAVEVAEPVALQKRLALTFRAAAERATFHGDPARLAQVFSNLLNNACRYTPAGGRIGVSIRTVGDAIEVSIEDSGIGIEPALQATVFDLFEQADKSLERGNAGLGVGLTLARQLVRLHGGDIGVESEGKGRGSRFTVRLPLSNTSIEAQGPGPSATSAATPTAAAGGRQVLLADDNVDFATSLAHLLAALGYSVRVLHDGLAALDAAATGAFDIALLDIGMPKMNGYDLARHLRAGAQTKAMRLVAITGWGQDSDRDAAARAGFDRHLVKPIDPEHLADVMTSLLAASASPRRQASATT